MKSIQRVFETKYDKKNEKRLGAYFLLYMRQKGYPVSLQELPFLSPFDFLIKKGETRVGFLEVKQKNEAFSHTELVPLNKWMFAQRTQLPCYMLVERENKRLLFNISRLIHDNKGKEQEIRRRADQPEGSTHVVIIPTDEGVYMYKRPIEKYPLTT